MILLILLFLFFSCLKEKNISSNGIVALILARGGSKGIPLKNLSIISGITLLGRALRIIKNSKLFDDIWVSTDNWSIAYEANFYHVNVHMRHESVSRDETTSLESIVEFLNGHRYVDNIALIQCTSVFIREKYLQLAVEYFQNQSIDCVFSVTRL